MQSKFTLILRTALPILFIGFLIASCGGSKKIATFTFDEYVMSNPGEKAQTKSNVTIEVEPLSPSKLYDHPELFSFNDQQIPEALQGINLSSYFPRDLDGKSWCWTFGTGRNILSAFKVKITNNTPHILRMKDARIYLVVGSEEPIAPVTKLGNTQLYEIGDEKKTLRPKSAIDADESLVHWVTYFEQQYEKERPKGFLSLTYPIGLASQVIAQNKSEYKLINDVSREILPDFSYDGILLFPHIVSESNVKLMFYDITTKTDAAGNPIEKTKFEFNLKIDTVDMWFDDMEKKWKIGIPPTTQAATN